MKGTTMRKTSRKAAKKWRKDHAPLTSRWYVTKNLYIERWSAYPPCTCSGSAGLFCGHTPTMFRTHAEAIAWADNQARKAAAEARR